MRMKMSRNPLAVVMMAMLLLMTACGDDDVAETTTTTTTTTQPATGTTEPDDEPKPPIVIGLITDLSGRFVSFGRDIDLATRFAVDKINSEGGINGSLLELRIDDTGGEPEHAVVSYRDFADAGVFAISGPLSSGEADVLFTQAAQIRVPIMTGTANLEGITEPGDGWAFRNQATNTALYLEAMPAWAEAYGVSTAVLVFDEQEPVTAGAARSAIPAVAEQLGIQIVNVNAPITFTRGQTDFSTTVVRIRETPADGLILMSAPAEAGLIARELARQGETRPILGHPAQGGADFFAQGGSDINDWVIPGIFDPTLDHPLTAEYVATVLPADPEPPTVSEAANYYDNILMFAEVMRAAGIDGTWSADDARAAIREGLLALTDFRGVAGLTTYLPNGDSVKTVYIDVVINGERQRLGG
jgi:branched-chain amino acid transport system substrate-binding protein